MGFLSLSRFPCGRGLDKRDSSLIWAPRWPGVLILDFSRETNVGRTGWYVENMGSRESPRDLGIADMKESCEGWYWDEDFLGKVLYISPLGVKGLGRG